LDVVDDLLGAARALAERLQDREGHAVVWGVTELTRVETGKRDHMGNAVRMQSDVFHLLHHGIGTLE